jgi:hypothetical protein
LIIELSIACSSLGQTDTKAHAIGPLLRGRAGQALAARATILSRSAFERLKRVVIQNRNAFAEQSFSVARPRVE